MWWPPIAAVPTNSALILSARSSVVFLNQITSRKTAVFYNISFVKLKRYEEDKLEGGGPDA
jgi:hypothetical protein